jgi:hypothetical protein
VTERVVDCYSEDKAVKKLLRNTKQLIKQGTKEDRLFKITRGRAYIVKKANKTKIPLLELKKGDYFGNFPFVEIGQEPYNCSVYISKDLKIKKIDFDDFQNEYRGISQTFKNMIQNMGTCIAVTTMVAIEHYNKAFKKSK